jgi:hypothetical protein
MIYYKMKKAGIITLILLSNYPILFAQEKTLSKPDPPSIAFSIDEKDLFPESITYDPQTKQFFLGSISKEKVVAVDQSGKQTDFIRPRQDGMLRSLGLKVDEARRRLWIVSESDWDKNVMSAVHIYNIDTKKLIISFFTPENSNLTFNDLVLTKAGSAYISDWGGNSIYQVSSDLSSLDLVIKSDSLLVGANGMVMSSDSSFLYVASHTRGIVLLDLRTKSIRPVINRMSIDTRGIDGLMSYRNSLIGILNGDQDRSKHYIARYSLSTDGFEITSASIIDQKNPLFDEPTSGVIIDDELYCLAATYLHLFAIGRETPADQLHKPIVLKYKLRKESE